MTSDIGPENFRCDCHREIYTMSGWYENYYYFNREFNFNVTYTVNAAVFRGSHVPMGYYEMEERSKRVLYANRAESTVWGGEEGAPVGKALRKYLGVIDEVRLPV